MLTPLDLHGKKFDKEFRGYNSKDVDEFFAQVVKDFEGEIRHEKYEQIKTCLEAGIPVYLAGPAGSGCDAS